jgi:hypothetical protein
MWRLWRWMWLKMLVMMHSTARSQRFLAVYSWIIQIAWCHKENYLWINTGTFCKILLFMRSESWLYQPSQGRRISHGSLVQTRWMMIFWACLCLGLVPFLKLSKSQAYYFKQRSAESYPPSPRVFTSPSLCLYLQCIQEWRRPAVEFVHQNLPKTCLTFTPATFDAKTKEFPEREREREGERESGSVKGGVCTKQSDMSSQWPSHGGCQHRGPWLTALHRQATADRSKPKFLCQSWWLWVKMGDVDAEPMGSTHLGIWPSHEIVRFGSHFGMGPGTRGPIPMDDHNTLRCETVIVKIIGPVGFWRSRSTEI